MRRWRSGVFGFLGLKALKAVSWKPCWFLQLETSFIKIKFFGEVEGGVGEEIFHVAAVFLGGTAQTGGAFYKASNAVHLKQVILLLGGDVLHHLRYQLGSDAVLNAL